MKIVSNSKFPLVLGITAILIALCAAFFSVYGISVLFAGASVSAMIMASSLELGKVVATTFLYRYWSRCKASLKVYLMVAILVLMTITSIGIFGYLSAAYQKSSVEFSISQEKISLVEGQKNLYQDKIESSKKRISDLTAIRSTQENRLSEVMTNEFLARNPIQLKQIQQQTIDLLSKTDSDIKLESEKIQSSISEIDKINSEISKLKLDSAGRKDVQTFKFVADSMGVPLDSVARWFIISIICVFDPLALCLILAYNVAVYKKEDEAVIVETPKNQVIEKNETKGEEVPSNSNNLKQPEIDPFFNSYFKQ